jgi:TRAP-type uncharacterized transport system substrate-binding protein
MLWEIGLHIAGNPETPYTGHRDICVSVGSGSGERYTPSLRMSSGSPILAHAVARGDLELAFVNPSGLLTQAYRGTGLFSEPLPVRIVVSYPSLDRFVILVHERTGITSLADLKEKRPALRVSVREDPTHSTRVLIDQILGLYGLSLTDIESWGGSLQKVGPPGDMRRVNAIQAGEIDLVWDEGLVNNNWFDVALAVGMRPIELEAPVRQQLEHVGWRFVTMPAGFMPHLTQPYTGIDYSGWPLYSSASLPDEMAYAVCDAAAARADEIPWEEGTFTNIGQLGAEAEATPRDVPLHPGSERWFREHGYIR